MLRQCYKRALISSKSLQPQHARRSDLSTENGLTAEKRADIANGPGLQDFIAGAIPRGSTYSNYEGKLKRSPGETSRFVAKHIFSWLWDGGFCTNAPVLINRLKLPPWLKVDIPKGSNFSRLKTTLRGKKLHTVSIHTAPRSTV